MLKSIFKTIKLIPVFLLLITFFNSIVIAHPQPLVVQEFLMNYVKDSVEMTYRLRVDPLYIDKVYPDLDTDNSNSLSEDEIKKYVSEVLTKNLTARMNNRDLVFEYQSSTLKNKTELRSLNDFIEVKLVAKDPKILEVNSAYLKYNKKYFPDDPYGDYFNYEDNILFDSSIERINIEQTNPSGLDEYSTDFKFKEYSGENISKQEVQSQTRTTQNIFDRMREYSTELTQNVRSYDYSNSFTFIIAVIVLLIAGAIHALTPGHGKSMVAAFLIGKKDSKFMDVLVLGASITFSHTAVIFAIGFILLAINQTSSATQVVSIIERISAWLFLGLGLILFYNGYKAYRYYTLYKNKHSHSHDHHRHTNLKIRNRWDLFYAGISGGIVPCIDALSILFLFTSIGRVDIGIFLVFIFSLGLAGAIILLGLSLLYGKNKLKLEDKIGEKAEFILPFVTGSIIFLFGIFYIFSK